MLIPLVNPAVGPGTPYDYENLNLLASKSNRISLQQYLPNALAFNSTGTRLFLLHGSSIYEFVLNTAYDLSTMDTTAAPTEHSMLSSATGIHFKSDGTKIYMMKTGGDIDEYPLSTAWDLSTTGTRASWENPTAVTGCRGIHIGDSGTDLFITSTNTTYDGVLRYALTTAWDITSANTTSHDEFLDKDTLGIDPPTGIAFDSAGTTMFLCTNKGIVAEIDLSTAWTLSSATLTRYNALDIDLDADLDTAGIKVEINYSFGMAAKPDGTVLFLGHLRPGYIAEYSLTTGWDISTASYVDASVCLHFSITPEGVVFNSTGTKIIACDGESIAGYTFTTGFDWSTDAGGHIVKWDDVEYIGVGSNYGGMAAKSDGTRLYIGDFSGHIHQISMDDGWDVSTAAHTYDYNPADGTQATGVALSSDGTKMYVYFDSTQDVIQYTLSTAWDLSTASPTGAAYEVDASSYVTGSAAPHNLEFKPDGMAFWLCDETNDQVEEFTLTTAWDLSTASYSQTYDIASGRAGGFVALSWFDGGNKAIVWGSNYFDHLVVV